MYDKWSKDAVLSCPVWDQSRFVTSPVWDQSNFTIFDVFTKPVKSGSIQSRNFTIAVDSGYLLRFRLKQRLTSLNDLHLEAVMSRGPPDIAGMVSLKVDNLSYRWVLISLDRGYQKLMVDRTRPGGPSVWDCWSVLSIMKGTNLRIYILELVVAITFIQTYMYYVT